MGDYNLVETQSFVETEGLVETEGPASQQDL